MTTFLLIIGFVLISCFEAIGYGLYEFIINKNKFSGASIIILALIGLVFPIAVYLTMWIKK